MTKKIVNWACEPCELDNIVEVDDDQGKVKAKDKKLYCIRCGISSTPQVKNGLINRPGGQWLPCLPLDAWNSMLPNGRLPNGYRSGDGKLLSREAYMREYGVDPLTCWRWLKSGRPTGKIQQSGAPLPAIIPDSGGASEHPPQKNEIETLKENEMLGHMGRVEYLTALMKLLNAGKIEKHYYDLEVDRVLSSL